MTQDVKIARDSEGVFDLVPDGTDFESVNGLETAIITSLFTYARADSGEVPDAYSRRGFAGNILDITDNYELGGVLWLISQSRLDQNALNRAQNFAYNSLLWMVTDGIVDSINIEVEKNSERSASITITLIKGRDLVERYIVLWRETQAVS